jgi:hypothetical protein
MFDMCCYCALTHFWRSTEEGVIGAGNVCSKGNDVNLGRRSQIKVSSYCTRELKLAPQHRHRKEWPQEYPFCSTDVWDFLVRWSTRIAFCGENVL